VYLRELAVQCTGSVWDGVNFLQRSLCGPVLWICDQSSIGNAPVFWLLLSSACTASRRSLFFHSALLVSRLGVGRRSGGDTARTAGPN